MLLPRWRFVNKGTFAASDGFEADAAINDRQAAGRKKRQVARKG